MTAWPPSLPCISSVFLNVFSQVYDEDDVAAAMSSAISSVATSFRTSASNGLAMLFHAKWNAEAVDTAMATTPDEFLKACGVSLARPAEPPKFPGVCRLRWLCFFLIRSSLSISFTRAQGIRNYKIGFGRGKGW